MDRHTKLKTVICKGVRILLACTAPVCSHSSWHLSSRQPGHLVTWRRLRQQFCQLQPKLFRVANGIASVCLQLQLLAVVGSESEIEWLRSGVLQDEIAHCNKPPLVSLFQRNIDRDRIGVFLARVIGPLQRRSSERYPRAYRVFRLSPRSFPFRFPSKTLAKTSAQTITST